MTGSEDGTGGSEDGASGASGGEGTTNREAEDGAGAEGEQVMTDGEHDDPTVEDVTELQFVGEATANVLSGADIGPDAILAKRVSHAQLLAAGVNPGVAAKIRREHSLSWSFEGGEDLDRRADQVRGLGDDERAWVAASAGDWEDDQPPVEATTDGSGSAIEAESAWQARSKPTPVTELDGVGAARAETLSRGGINSVRSMALADPEEVADSLDLAPKRVEQWREQARRRV